MATRGMLAVVAAMAMVAPGLAHADAGPEPDGGLVWGGDGRLTGSAGDELWPELSVGPDGSSHLLWARDGKLYYAREDRAGNVTIGEREVATGGVPMRPDGMPAERAAVDGGGAFHFMWTDGGRPLYGRLDGDGRLAAGPVELDPDGRNRSSAGMAVARDGRAWFCFVTGAGTVELARLDGAGGPGPGVEVGACAASATLALDAEDRPVLLWSCPENGTLGLCTLDADGGVLAGPRYLTPAVAVSAGTPLPAMAIAPDGTVHLLQADNATGRRELFYTRLGADGSQLAPHLRVASRAGDGGDLAAGGRGDLFLAWGDDFDGDLYYAMVRPGTGNGSVVPVRLTDAPGRDHDPRLGVDSDGGLHVAWASGRDGNEEVYGKHAFVTRVGLGLSAAALARLSGVMANGTRSAGLAVRNTGHGPDAFRVELRADLRGQEGGVGEGYGGAGWKVWLEGNGSAVALGAGQAAAVGLAVRGPEAGAPGDYICVTASAFSVAEPLARDELTFRTTLTGGRGLEVLCDPDAVTVLPGERAAYRVEVVNPGNATEQVRLEAQGPEGWDWTLDNLTLALPQGGRGGASLEVAPPAGAPGGDVGVVSVVATSTELWYLSDGADTYTTVEEVLGVEVRPAREETPVLPGETAGCDIIVEKSGNSGRALVLEAVVEAEGWNVTPGEKRVEIGGAGCASVPLRIRAPPEAVRGERVPVNVSCRDVEGTVEAGCTAYAVVDLAGNLQLRLEPDTAELEPGGSALFGLEVVNLGNGDDEVRPGEADLPENWTAAFFPRGESGPDGRVAVPFRGSARLDVRIGAPVDAPPGNRSFSLEMLGTEDRPYYFTVNVRVLPRPGVGLAAREDRRGGPAGGTADFVLDVGNEGNSFLNFTMEGSGLPQGWPPLEFLSDGRPMGGARELWPRSSAAVTARVRIPERTPLDDVAFGVRAVPAGGEAATANLTLHVLKPELRITSVAFPAAGARAGEPETVDITLENAGDGGASGVALALFVDGRRERLLEIGNLSAGESRTEGVIWVPAAGTHLLRFVIDPGDLVFESDETDNEASATRAVAGGGGEEGLQVIWVAAAAGLTAGVAGGAAAALLALRRSRHRKRRQGDGPAPR